MKVKQLRAVLAAVADQKSRDGSEDAARALQAFAGALAGHDTKTVSAIAKRIGDRES